MIKQRSKFEQAKEFISIAQSIVVIIGLPVGIISLYLAYRSLSLNNELASANFVLEISKKMNSPRYDRILMAIEDNPGNYPLIKKRITSDDVEDYIGNFETVGNLIHDGIIDIDMAYDELGYDAEKAWCNRDVKRVIDEVRKVDRIKSGPNAFYAGFEKLATYSLLKDKKKCEDIDKE